MFSNEGRGVSFVTDEIEDSVFDELIRFFVTAGCIFIIIIIIIIIVIIIIIIIIINGIYIALINHFRKNIF